MEQFTWDSYFETGLHDVDSQHHGLVDLINRFGGLLLQPQDVASGQLRAVLDELARYAQLHFSEEEQWMADRCLDPRSIEAHKVKHADFLREVQSQGAALGTVPGPAAARLHEFLVAWLAFHILGMDQSMARQMAAIEGGATPSEALAMAGDFKDPATATLVHSMHRLFRQISDRNRELHELNLSLEARVAERTEELSEANRRLEALALTDTLTGLPNRRTAVRRLAAEWALPLDEERPLACLMIDADGFKQVNDRHGHDAGDTVIRTLGQCLAESVRNDDIVCRLGGDEFLVLGYGTPLAGATRLAEHLLRRVNELSVVAGSGRWDGRISVGVAVREPWMNSPDALLKAADEALYMAKSRGRNQVASAFERG